MLEMPPLIFPLWWRQCSSIYPHVCYYTGSGFKHMNGGTKNLFSGNYFPLDVIQGIFESATGAIFGRIVNLLLSLCLTFVRLNLFTQPKFWPITIISQNHCKTNLVFWEYIHFENIFSILKANKTRILLLSAWLQMALKGSWQCILRWKIFKKNPSIPGLVNVILLILTGKFREYLRWQTTVFCARTFGTCPAL